MTVKPWKIPVSVLVVIHTPALGMLLLERADHPGWWQSVTGSQDPGESLARTAWRELDEETGLGPEDGLLVDMDYSHDFEIYPCYRHRYAPGITHNREHVFAFSVPSERSVRLAPKEHLAWQWRPWQEAADLCFSPSNAEAIRRLARDRAQLFAGAAVNDLQRPEASP